MSKKCPKCGGGTDAGFNCISGCEPKKPSYADVMLDNTHPEPAQGELVDLRNTLERAIKQEEVKENNPANSEQFRREAFVTKLAFKNVLAWLNLIEDSPNQQQHQPQSAEVEDYKIEFGSEEYKEIIVTAPDNGQQVFYPDDAAYGLLRKLSKPEAAAKHESAVRSLGMSMTVETRKALAAEITGKPAQEAGGVWISVEDRLPEDGTVVLVSAGKRLPQYQSDAEFKGGKFFLWCIDEEEHLVWEPTVTHWMPLPTPPEADDE